jgi:transposase
MAACPSPLPALLPDPSKLNLDGIVQQDGVTVIRVSAAEVFADCPLCGIQSVHVHSRYCHTLRDLPCHGSLVRIELRARRFYFRIQDCRRRVFTQRLPTVVPPYGRQLVVIVRRCLPLAMLSVVRAGTASLPSWHSPAVQTRSYARPAKAPTLNLMVT